VPLDEGGLGKTAVVLKEFYPEEIMSLGLITSLFECAFKRWVAPLLETLYPV